MKSLPCELIAFACLILFGSGSAAAFSPYELYLQSGRTCHVGLIAQILPDKAAEFAESLSGCADGDTALALARAGISEVQGFQRVIAGTHWGIIYFRYAGGKDYHRAAAAFEQATGAAGWQQTIAAHPRARRYGRLWLQMEWINFIHGRAVAGPAASSLMLGTTIIPAKEQLYRTLHQTVWPGVVDQVIRGNIRNLNIFMVELDALLVEFLYLEYIGTDETGDDAMNKADPINQRWWQLTDACQQAFPDARDGGPWVLLERVPANSGVAP